METCALPSREGVLPLLAFAGLSQERGPVTAQEFAAYGHTGQRAGPSPTAPSRIPTPVPGNSWCHHPRDLWILSPPCRSRDCPPLLHLNTLRLVCPPSRRLLKVQILCTAAYNIVSRFVSWLSALVGSGAMSLQDQLIDFFKILFFCNLYSQHGA